MLSIKCVNQYTKFHQSIVIHERENLYMNFFENFLQNKKTFFKNNSIFFIT